MQRLFIRLFIFLIAAIVPGQALAQVTPAAGYTPPDDTQSIRVGAVIFYDYSFTSTPKTTDAGGNSISANSFNVPRAYINITGNVSSIVGFRITPDITRESGSGSSLNGSMSFRLKYAYAQMNLDRFTGNWRSTYVRAGIQQTPFIDGEEGVYRYRFQGTLFAERDGGLSSADAGLSFHTNIPNNYGDIHVGVYNGDGYSRAEANDQKALMLRATVRPMPGGGALARGLRVTGYIHEDKAITNADRKRAIGSVWLEQRKFNFGFDYLRRSDEASATAARIKSDGFSFFLTPFFQEKGNGFEALLRYDSFRPNSDLDARQNRAIAGLAYWFPHPGGNATSALLLNVERVMFKDYETAQPTQQRIILSGLINF